MKQRFFIIATVVSMIVCSVFAGCGLKSSDNQPAEAKTDDSMLNYERNQKLLDRTEETEVLDLYGMELKAENEKEVEAILNDYATYFGVSHCVEDLVFYTVTDVLGEKCYRYQQYYDDLPVYGKELIVNVEDNSVVSMINNTVYIENAATETQTDALNSICETLEMDIDKLNELSTKYLYDNHGEYRIVFAISTEDGEFIIADATNGEIIKRECLIDSENAEDVELQGQTENHKVDITKDNNRYVLFDAKRNIFVYDLSANDEFLKYDEKFSKGILIHFDNEKECKNGSAVDALFNIELAYDFYDKVLNHKSSDGKGKIKIRIYDGFEEYIDIDGKSKLFTNNAASWGRPNHGTTEILISPKVGVTYANGLDVMGHEFTHSIIDYSLNADFSKPEGKALNEGISDILGLMIEAYYNNKHECDWIITNSRNYNQKLKQKYTEYKESDDCHDGGTIICNVARQMWNGNPKSKDIEPIKDPELMAELWYRTIMMINADLDYKQCRTLVELNALNMKRQKKLTKEQYQCVLWAFDQADIKYTLISGWSDNPFLYKQKQQSLPPSKPEFKLRNPKENIFLDKKNAYPSGIDITATVYDYKGDTTEEYDARVIDSKKQLVYKTNGESLMINLPVGVYTIEIMEKNSDIVVYRGLIRICYFDNISKEVFLDLKLNSIDIYTELGRVEEIQDDTASSWDKQYAELYCNNMEIPVNIYTFFVHFTDIIYDSGSKAVDINDPYTFWMMLSVYATMESDDDMITSGSKLAESYRTDEQGEMLVLSEEEVRDAVNAMMPGITEYPEFPNVEYERPYKMDGNYYLPFIDLDTESTRMTDIKINDDGTATAIVEAFTYLTGEIYETYQINLIRNDNINLNSPEPYPYCIESISVFRP